MQMHANGHNGDNGSGDGQKGKMQFLNSSDWTIQWSGPSYKDASFTPLHEYQYLNHFSGSTEMTRKDSVWKHYQAMQRLFGKTQFDFIPETFIVPDQLEQFIQAFEAHKEEGWVWIAKPHASSRGRGIFLLTEL